jgi:hypothetical protein
MKEHCEATAIHAVPAVAIANGFRLLVMRELRNDTGTPAFAFIEQRLLRSPERRNRHGISFALTFRPEIMAWLISELGRPAERDARGVLSANVRWPRLGWFEARREWADGICTVEWFADISFHDEASRAAFAQAWQARLMGEGEADATT